MGLFKKRLRNHRCKISYWVSQGALASGGSRNIISFVLSLPLDGQLSMSAEGRQMLEAESTGPFNPPVGLWFCPSGEILSGLRRRSGRRLVTCLPQMVRHIMLIKHSWLGPCPGFDSVGLEWEPRVCLSSFQAGPATQFTGCLV